ncbi:hypothetical protein ACG7TL_006163 [Trametes sanguinea]
MSIYQRPAPLRSGPRIVHPPAAPRSRSARLSGCAGSPFEHRAQPVAYCPALLLSREERCEDPPGDPKPSAPLCSSGSSGSPRLRLERREQPAAYYPALLLSREERCEDPPGDPNPSALLSSSLAPRATSAARGVLPGSPLVTRRALRGSAWRPTVLCSALRVVHPPASLRPRFARLSGCAGLRLESPEKPAAYYPALLSSPEERYKYPSGEPLPFPERLAGAQVRSSSNEGCPWRAARLSSRRARSVVRTYPAASRTDSVALRSRFARLSGCAGSPSEHREQPVAYCPALLSSRQERYEYSSGEPLPFPERLAGAQVCSSSDEGSL